MTTKSNIVRRDASIIAAIQGGIATAPDLARVFNTTTGLMNRTVNRLCNSGLIEFGGYVVTGRRGIQPARWRVREAAQ